MFKNKYLRLFVVLPHRGIAQGKSRLAEVIDDTARAQLNRWLLARTLDIAAKWSGEARRCMVVSPCDQALAIAHDSGATGLREQGAGLNAALAQAAAHAAVLGAQRLLILPCDLPLLNADALSAIAAVFEHDGGVVLAPDRHGAGTNGLLVDAAERTFSFGADSVRRHSANFAARGEPISLCHRPELAFDLDTAEDLAQWLHSGHDLPPFLARHDQPA